MEGLWTGSHIWAHASQSGRRHAFQELENLHQKILRQTLPPEGVSHERAAMSYRHEKENEQNAQNEVNAKKQTQAATTHLRLLPHAVGDDRLCRQLAPGMEWLRRRRQPRRKKRSGISPKNDSSEDEGGIHDQKNNSRRRLQWVAESAIVSGTMAVQ